MTFKLPASLLLGFLIADSAFQGFACQVKPTDAGDAAVVGDWRGDSICVVRESACHDEDSFYHVKRLPEKPGWFSVKFDKLVSGHPITMGSQECRLTMQVELDHRAQGSLQEHFREQCPAVKDYFRVHHYGSDRDPFSQADLPRLNDGDVHLC